MRRLFLSLLAVGLLGMTIGCSGTGMTAGRCDCYGEACCLRPAPWQLRSAREVHYAPIAHPAPKTKTPTEH